MFYFKEGGLDLHNCAPGRMAGFNLYNYEMSIDELNSLSCADLGNTVSWKSLQQMGSSSSEQEDLECQRKLL